MQNYEKGDDEMKNNMMNADDISKEIGVSKGTAYKIIKSLNEELKANGFIVVSGRVPRAFWETRFFNNSHMMAERRE